MIQTDIKLTKLTAAEGMVLTNGDVFGKEVYLGKGDSPDKWYEITEEEAQKIQDGRNETDELLLDSR